MCTVHTEVTHVKTNIDYRNFEYETCNKTWPVREDMSLGHLKPTNIVSPLRQFDIVWIKIIYKNWGLRFWKQKILNLYTTINLPNIMKQWGNTKIITEIFTVFVFALYTFFYP